uniref:Uncharacterized protein n=1 Tax=Lygus hesperus TaxID=30085 RepID=A0A146M3J2_LYGHE
MIPIRKFSGWILVRLPLNWLSSKGRIRMGYSSQLKKWKKFLQVYCLGLTKIVTVPPEKCIFKHWSRKKGFEKRFIRGHIAWTGYPPPNGVERDRRRVRGCGLSDWLAFSRMNRMK